MNRRSQLRRLGLFDAKVPRYTSYPPTTHFSDRVDAGRVSDWVRDVAPGTRISVYLHIPFCRKLCWFCAYRTQGMRDAAPLRAYVETLKAEIALLRNRLPEGVEIARLHWGGGTPTLLPPDLIRDLADTLHRAFPGTEMPEFTVEIDPNEIDDARLDALAAAGMTRASIGVQDFDPEVQKLIGRSQSFEATRDVVDALRARGVTSLNADILYGLPAQTRERIADSVQMLLSLAPDRVALYGYAHVPWLAKRQSMIPTATLATPEERLELFETARRLLLWDSYAEIGIDHFARPGDALAIARENRSLRRGFQGCTDDTGDVLIGLGASAISRFPQGYAQNAPSTAVYQKAIDAGRLATVRGHRFTGDDTLRARLIEALLCEFRIDSAEICADFDITPAELSSHFKTAAKAFPEITRHDPSGFEILPEGRALARVIARAFDAYDIRTKGHSSAF